MKEKQKKQEPRPMQMARERSQLTAAKTVPQGSWTGRPLDPYEKPVQDADDL